MASWRMSVGGAVVDGRVGRGLRQGRSGIVGPSAIRSTLGNTHGLPIGLEGVLDTDDGPDRLDTPVD